VAECSYVALLRYLRVLGLRHETALIGGGEDAATLLALETVDPRSDTCSRRLHASRQDAGFVERTRAIARLLSDPRGMRSTARAHCDQASFTRRHAWPPAP